MKNLTILTAALVLAAAVAPAHAVQDGRETPSASAPIDAPIGEIDEEALTQEGFFEKWGVTLAVGVPLVVAAAGLSVFVWLRNSRNS
jgi:hypothetical protein